MGLIKIKPKKEEEEEEAKINFIEEPNKSQNQIQKIIKVFLKNVTTKSKFMLNLSKGTDEIKLYDEGAEREVKQNINESLEVATLIFESL